MNETSQDRAPSTLIQIVWSGPFPLAATGKYVSDRTDFGVYQIYGTYQGTTGLIYIGRAMKGSFGWRSEHHDKNKLAQYGVTDASFRLGRFAGSVTPPNAVWEREIELAESLLIYAHCPPINVRIGLGELETHVERLHITNWGESGSLLPEVSGWRWTKWGESLPKNIYDASHNDAALDTN